MTVTIYHNPRCSNSREALALIRAAGIEPVIVEYLNAPLSSEALAELIANAGLRVRQAMREKEAVYAELGLSGEGRDDALLAAIVAHPVLLNRPFVVTHKGTRLCRPPELVNGLL